MTQSPTPKPKVELKQEWQIFEDQLTRLVNVLINRWFDLKPGSARRRLIVLITLLILAGFAISLAPYPLDEWRHYFERLFSYLRHSNARSLVAVAGFLFELIERGVQAYINPYVLWYAPAFFLPIFIAFQAASFYIADIFELSHIRVARKFLRQVALTGSQDVLHISQGEIVLQDRDSPIYKIGGPGKVIVDLDSVALFEKVDGHPKVIGPTEKEPKGKATLDGFERFRQALDLRDHYIDLRDDSGKYAAVKSRSLDGIPVAATDVRLMFSIYRGGKTPTPEMPYPYAKEAIEQQVYKATAHVTPNVTDASKFVFIFENSILSMVRRQLSRFMSQKRLTEYLASIDWPEVKKAEEREKKVLEEARLVLEPLESVEEEKRDFSPPPFVPRREITDLFGQFTKSFTDDAREKGVELHWIGIGTWNVPLEIVTSKHLDAWKMSRENDYLDSKETMDKAKNTAKIQRIVSMIQDVPLAVYQERIRSIDDRNVALRTLLLEYGQQINDNFESLRRNKKPIPPTLVAALFFIRSEFGRFVPPPPAPAPATQREGELYEVLLRKIGFFEVVEQLIGLEFEKSPNSSREEALEKINSDWDLDIARKWRP